MQVPVEKIITIAVSGVLFTAVFIPLLRYFIVSYFQDMREDMKDMRDNVTNINKALTDHMEKDSERFSRLDERCADRFARISRIEGRMNGK